MLKTELYRMYGIRKQQQLKAPVPHPMAKYSLPYFSMIHYLPSESGEVGMDMHHPILTNNEEDVLVEHIFDQETPLGSVREVKVQEAEFIKNYHRRYLRARRLRNLDTALRVKKTVINFNYAPSTAKYVYRATALSGYHESSNLLLTGLKGMVNRSDNVWDHWLPMELPERLPELATLKRIKPGEEIAREMVPEFNEPNELLVLAIYQYLMKEESMLDVIPREIHSRINFLFMESGHWIWINLEDLSVWLEDSKTDVLAKDFLRGLEVLIEKRTVAEPSTEEEAEAPAISRSEMKKKALTAPIMDRADELLASGLLSAPQYKRMQRLAERYTELPALDGEGTLEEFLDIQHEELELVAKRIPDIDSVLDKSMLQSTLIDYDKKYIDKVFKKDIANMGVAVQKAGAAVVDFKSEDNVDIAGATTTYKMRVQPADGDSSTLSFTVPKIAKDGTFKVNGVKYRMAKQPCDLPIRKVKPERVALTSYYGKVFVTRSERTVDDYAAWIAKRVIAATLDSDGGYTNAHYGDVYKPTYKVPRAYSGIARRSAGFTFNSIVFNFDYSKREELYGAEAVKKAEKNGGVVCGIRLKKLIVMDDTNVLWEDGKELGFIEQVLGITGKVPTDTANINIFGKPLPVGMVLAYSMGLTTLLKRLGTKYRIVQRGTRNELTPGEYAIVFKDVSLILNRSDKTSSIILSGFNTHTRQIKEVHMHQFDSQRTYNTVLARENLRPTRFLKELDLMNNMFIDHITLELLREMKEPEELNNLIIRACELLTTDEHAVEVDATQMRYRGYERMAGMVYTEMISAIRKYKARPPGTGASIDLNPYAVAIAIQKDASIALVEDSNPIHNLKEMELVSHSGAGGRSSRTMNGESRLYHKTNIGTISEATVDSSKVAVNTLLSSDPKFTTLRGKTEQYDEKSDTMNRVMSTSANISPFADKDD